MSTNGVNEAFKSGYTVKLQDRGAKSSGITWELKSIFKELVKNGVIKDKNGDGFTKDEAKNLYAVLNAMHQNTNRATNYTTMQVNQQFSYTADEMKVLAQAAGYEISNPAAEPVENRTAVTSEEPENSSQRTGSPVVTGSSEGENPGYGRIVKGEDAAADPAPAYLLQEKHLPETGPANNPKYEESRLSLVEADFSANGQVGKISDGKYYINGSEVTKEVYDMAKTRAASTPAEPEISNQNSAAQDQLTAYLKQDNIYQQYKSGLAEMDEKLTSIETKYDFKRGDLRGSLKLIGTADDQIYTETSLSYKLLSEDLKDYEAVMQSWQDGSSYNFYRRNNTEYTNCVKITLSNGQRAWKTDQGTFYPGPNGMPGLEEVPEEELGGG